MVFLASHFHQKVGLLPINDENLLFETNGLNGRDVVVSELLSITFILNEVEMTTIEVFFIISNKKCHAKLFLMK